MKKKTLLTLVATGAFVVTTAGSYAAWDNYKATSSTTINFNSVDVTASKDLTLTLDKNGGEKPIYTGTVEIDVAGVSAEDLAQNKITLTPTADANGASVLDKLEVTFTQTGDTVTNTSNVGSDTTVAEKNIYSVKITPKDDNPETKTALRDKDISFTVNADMASK